MGTSFFINGAVGVLETSHAGAAEGPPRYIAIICHPHPSAGGTMDHKVVTTLVKACTAMGAATLRFNYRGVGQSTGTFDDAIGECDDLRAVIRWAVAQYPGLPLILAGFSFGAYIAARVANDDSVAKALITIAPAVVNYDFQALKKIACPWLVVQGDQDEIVDSQKVVDWVNQAATPIELTMMAGAGHFFHGQLITLREIVIDWLRSVC